MNHQIIAISWNHRCTPIEFRDSLSLNWSEQRHFLHFTLEGNSTVELVGLSTCNRVEFYAVSKSAQDVLSAIENIYTSMLKRDISWKQAKPKIYVGVEAFKHLCRVSVGMESMVIGEYQILSQVKVVQKTVEQIQPKYESLIKLFSSAIFNAEKIRNEISIGSGPTSISALAVRKLVEIFGTLTNKSVLIVGAGETATLTAECLKNTGVSSFTIANRNEKNGIALAANIDGQYIHLEAIVKELESCDIVIAATNTRDFIVCKSQIESLMYTRKNSLTLLDISTPRNIDPSIRDIVNVDLFDLDHLHNTNIAEVCNDSESLEEAEKHIVELSKDMIDFLDSSYARRKELEYKEETH